MTSDLLTVLSIQIWTHYSRNNRGGNWSFVVICPSVLSISCLSCTLVTFPLHLLVTPIDTRKMSMITSVKTVSSPANYVCDLLAIGKARVEEYHNM